MSLDQEGTSYSPVFSIRHTDGKQIKFSMTIKKKQFYFGGIETKMSFLVPVNRLKVIFKIRWQFKLIKPIRISIKTGVNNFVLD